MTPASSAQAAPQDRTPLDKLRAALITPIRAMRLRYLPLLMIYYAYGALGLVAIAEAFWVKEALSFSPAQLAAIGVWLTLPWTIKMVFGQLADSVPIFGSQRRIYVFIGASLVASGLPQQIVPRIDFRPGPVSITVHHRFPGGSNAGLSTRLYTPSDDKGCSPHH